MYLGKSKHSIFSTISLLMCILMPLFSTIRGSMDLYENQANYVRKLQKEDGMMVNVIISDIEKFYSHYQNVNYELAFVYSGNGQNKSYFVSELNDRNNQELIYKFKGIENPIVAPSFTANDDGHRDFTYIGLSCDYGEIKPGKADFTDCYLTHKLVKEIAETYETSEDEILHNIFDLGHNEVIYCGKTLYIQGIFDDRTSYTYQTLYGGFIALEWNCFIQTTAYEVKYGCELGFGQMTIQSILKAINLSMPKDNGFVYEFASIKNLEANRKTEDEFFAPAKFQNKVFVILFAVLAFISEIGYIVILLSGINKGHFKSNDINKHLLIYVILLFGTLIFAKYANAKSIFNLPLLTISTLNIVLYLIISISVIGFMCYYSYRLSKKDIDKKISI